MPASTAAVAVRSCPSWCTEVHDSAARYLVHRGTATRLDLAETEEPLEVQAYQADDGHAVDVPLVHLRLDGGQCTVIRLDEARRVALALLEVSRGLGD